MTTHLFGDTSTLTGRSMTHISRSPDTIITTAIMPVAIMLMFGYVFGGAIDTGPLPRRARRQPARRVRVVGPRAVLRPVGAWAS